MPLHAKAWQLALKPLGRSVSRRRIYEWEGESGVVTARTLLAETGATPSLQAIKRLLAEKERRFSELASRIRVPPTLARLLQDLEARRIRLGLVTGTSSREVRRVVSKDLLARFQVVVTGDGIRRGKPHPDPYLRAFARLRALPKRAIVVENAPYGIRAARAAGAGLVIALASSLPARYLHEAHTIVPTVRRLSALLRTLTAGH